MKKTATHYGVLQEILPTYTGIDVLFFLISFGSVKFSFNLYFPFQFQFFYITHVHIYKKLKLKGKIEIERELHGAISFFLNNW